MADEQKIVVEIPDDRGYLPVPSTNEPSNLDKFKKGWINAIALPDNLPDLAFDITACVTIPALISSCWVTIPLPDFLRLGFLVMLIIVGGCLLYLRQAVPEVKDVLLIRVGLVAVGVILGT
ncbi:hypothetical protein IQ244_20190 [Nostoc sp. LEGE 06077]|uniref:hypothetical protein n=1 Tax=Nostoc sp. LEGE 06077 TaxID=915325 RepID=UPI001881491E|nr:hypothetical protein [Nostoc sp. LEGE 06077]MBE9208819.1 hypothetical protein [Nostoc sp. LEGE 06077]